MKNIFLIGMPSSGKSTMGRRLARALNYQFVDLDQSIVKDQNRTIPEIFAEKGEKYFRKIEQKLLNKVQPNQRLIVATGGGTPCFFDNMKSIQSRGMSLFLNVSPCELATRILNHNQDDRPLLSGIGDLEAELTSRLADRLPYYSQADLIISGKTNDRQILEMLLPLL